MEAIIPTLILIATLSFTTQFQCVQHLDNESSNPPIDSHVYRLNINTTIVELHGGHAVLRCRGGNYFAYTLENRNGKETDV